MLINAAIKMSALSQLRTRDAVVTVLGEGEEQGGRMCLRSWGPVQNARSHTQPRAPPGCPPRLCAGFRTNGFSSPHRGKRGLLWAWGQQMSMRFRASLYLLQLINTVEAGNERKKSRNNSKTSSLEREANTRKKS